MTLDALAAGLGIVAGACVLALLAMFLDDRGRK